MVRKSPPSSLARLRLLLQGRVQGVGFRPWLYRLAKERSLNGSIANSEAGVAADLEGETSQLLDLLQRIPHTLPLHAELDHVSHEWLSARGVAQLEILASEDQGCRGARIPSDLTTCGQCREELENPKDRRYRYPFINCTACGPRFTIVEAIPYDRRQTSMRIFPLCPVCAHEYQDPLDRRYHAEPTACPACGPQLRLVDGQGHVLAADPLAGAEKLLRQGQIVAIKGLGGFHLAVDAKNPQAVAHLRERKGRQEKPLAVMVRDLEEARRQAIVSQTEAELLRSACAPIVLLRRRAESDLSESVAPGNPYLGLMLPYTPIHYVLLATLPALVMTSGNLTEEPIAIDNEEARARLHGLADAFLEHDRSILVACDDSVVYVSETGPLLLRRSRGYVPDPVRLPLDAGQILAVGGQLKNTFCLTLGSEAYLGPHIGDLDNLESYEHFQRALQHMMRLLRLNPSAVVHDLHPDYQTTRYASEMGLPALAVQHHQAHVAATAIDHGLDGPLLGVALDGTGYGTDGTIWGGEFLLLPDLGHCQRVGHLRPFWLPGGEACIKAPQRTALALVHELLGSEATERVISWLAMPPDEAQAIQQMIERQVGVIRTTSCGRLFDAVAALCGLGKRVTYEGQPAMELEFLAGELADKGYSMEVGEGDPVALDPAPAIAQILADLASGVSRRRIAARFHRGLAAGLAVACKRLAARAGVDRVVLGGGCFQNRILVQALGKDLAEQGLSAYLPRRVPVNDGGLALGQVAVFVACAQ